ncbi:retention module-containing protein, partial [Campylobacter sp. MOP7]|uniref:retention module-containing protein n=1 Tax=Campylobacter canis TaxID=3378588 RepID=UPI00387E2B0D
MATTLGIIKQLSGQVVARDAQGNERNLNVGDTVFVGETVVTLTGDSKAVISTLDGKEITLLGNDEISLNETLIDSGSNSNVLADINDLQRAILEGQGLNTLEETAAGGDAGLLAVGASLTQELFTKSGSISNVFEGFPDLDNTIDNLRTFDVLPANSSREQDGSPDNPINPQPEAPKAAVITFNEDKDNDGKLDGNENKENPNTTTAEVKLPDGGKIGDVLVINIVDQNGTPLVKDLEVPITQDILDNGYPIKELPIKEGDKLNAEVFVKDPNTNLESPKSTDDLTIEKGAIDPINPQPEAPKAAVITFNEDKDNDGK